MQFFTFLAFILSLPLVGCDATEPESTHEPPKQYERYQDQPFNDLSFGILRGWSMERDGNEFVFSYCGAYPILKLQTVRDASEYINVNEFIEMQTREEEVDALDIIHKMVSGFEAIEYQ